MPDKDRQKGFTVIELMAVLTITTVTLIAVLQFYQSCIRFTTDLRQRLAQTTALNFCLDRMITEITDALTSKAELELISRQDKIVSGVKLTEYDGSADKKITRQLEWVIAADEHGGNTIYRREYAGLEKDADDSYYPICDRVADFAIEVVNADGLTDPNANAPLMQFGVEGYIDDNTEATFTAIRTFCLRRNEALGVPDLDELQNKINTIMEKRQARRNASATKAKKP